jgi:D-alanyl-D-alanine carboxypeptidase/D-alanyl-D-alanine-endopeptidase (penicillin-binding protein 4)
MKKIAFLLSLACIVAGSGSVRAQEALPAAVSQALRVAGIPAAHVAVVVQDVGADRPSLRHQASVPMNPASTMKLVTTYAALEMLGPAYRWKTEAHLQGTLREGVLEGNLVLRGTGDPKLNIEAFWMLLRALRGKGLREVRGDLVLDRGHFAPAQADSGGFDGDAFRPYNVLPDALLVNFNSLRFAFVADRGAGGVRIAVEPRPPALEVINVLKLSEGACPEGRAFRELLKPSFDPAKQRAIFAGQYPASCGEKELNVAMLEPNVHVAGVMRQLWTEMGGTWAGAVREGLADAGARPFHVHESAPLGEIVRDMNKFSNNVMARQLFLTLGAQSAGAPAGSAKSSDAIRARLAQNGIAAAELVMENGSGLSRAERISAATLAAVLQAGWRSNVMPEFIASMPIAAVDGTMRRRLKGEGVSGNAHIKTGLLSDARAIAGYVLDRRGRRQAVVMFVNHPNASAAQGAMDALLRWVYEAGPH